MAVDFPLVYVVFPVYNRKASTLAFLQQLAEQDYPNIQAVVCDDASSDGTAEAISQGFPNCELLHGNGRLWWTAGINRCIDAVLKHAHAHDFILTINDDVYLNKDYISQKVARAKEMPKSIIGSVCVDKESPDTIETSGLTLSKSHCTLHPLFPHRSSLTTMKKRCTELVAATHLPGKGVLIPVDVYRQLGLYNEKYLPQYHADTEFTHRASLAGIAVWVDMHSCVFSDVNRYNAGKFSNKVSFKQLLYSIRSPYGLNSWRAYNYLASCYFPHQRFRYLFITYIKILGGILKRKIRHA